MPEQNNRSVGNILRQFSKVALFIQCFQIEPNLNSQVPLMNTTATIHLQIHACTSRAARMRLKKPCPLETNLLNCYKINGRNSRTQDVIDWAFPNKIPGCATGLHLSNIHTTAFCQYTAATRKQGQVVRTLISGNRCTDMVMGQPCKATVYSSDFKNKNRQQLIVSSKIQVIRKLQQETSNALQHIAICILHYHQSKPELHRTDSKHHL